ncbi:hypothetical protein DMUE_6230, partial [Dictyocoela muelleri]
FILYNDIVPATKICDKCLHDAPFIIYIRDNNKHLGYRCKTTGCQTRKPLYKTNMPICKFVHILYLLIPNSTYKQLNLWYDISNHTIHNMKKILRKAYSHYLEQHPVRLGGLGI